MISDNTSAKVVDVDQAGFTRELGIDLV